MNLNSEMFREIELQRWTYEHHNHRKPTAIVIHPDFYFGVAMQIGPNGKVELYGMEITLSKDIVPNEFIIGEKFKVEDKSNE